MKIAICDDDYDDRVLLLNYVTGYDAALECSLFSSAEELMDACKKDFYDLIFLDIEMEGLDGFHAAKKIVGGDTEPLIIFVTKSSKYTIRGYEVAFRYVVKPVSPEDFTAVMTAALESIIPQKITVDINGRVFLLNVQDIYYFEVLNHKIRIHTKNCVYDYREALKNVEDQLAGSHFVRPHNSYLINLDHIHSVTQTEIVMKDQLKITISRKKKDEFFSALHRYLRR